jgi:glycosyltransferase involved in cell wall biosynthesis
MKKILFINDHSFFGGGGDLILRIEAKEFENRGFNVQLLCFNRYNYNNQMHNVYVVKDSKNHLIRRFHKFIGSVNIYYNIKKILNYIKPDLVRVHLVSEYPAEVYRAIRGYNSIQVLHGPNLFCSTSWGNIKKDSSDCELGIGIKCYLRGCVPIHYYLLYAHLKRRYLKYLKDSVNLYQCPSIFIKNKAEGVGLTPTIHIPNCVDYEYLNVEQARHEGDSTVLFVGSISEPKGVMYLPEMLMKIKKNIENVKLIICGRGQLADKIKKEFKKRNLQNNVIFKGFVDNKNLLHVYKMAHVVVMPSIWAEICGVVGLEALACGVPVIATNVGGIPEWLKDGENGFIVPPRNTDILAEKVIELLKDKNKRVSFGKKGRAYIQDNHNPYVYLKKVFAYYV